jgi:hypothetical protein
MYANEKLLRKLTVHDTLKLVKCVLEAPTACVGAPEDLGDTVLVDHQKAV